MAFVTKWVQPQGDVVACSEGDSDQCLFDVAFVTKWVQPRETLLLALMGKEKKRGGLFVLCQRLKRGFE